MKYTQAVHDRICEELRRGQRPQGACARAGISKATFDNWIEKGLRGDPALIQFAEDVELAYNEAEAKAVDVVTSSGFNGEMSADDVKWWLERARSEGYSKQVKTTVENQQAEFINRLERTLMNMPGRYMTGPQVFELVLSIAAGQSRLPTLPEHVETQATTEE